jgi:eukaryotic-like serine/threonine-protein kinase
MIGTIVNQYRILEKIGKGGMGTVYKAEDTKLERFVALKFLPDEMTGDRVAMERFRREARAASALSHPNICTIYDIDSYEGRQFIAMELLDGHTLRQHITNEGLDADEVVKLAMQIAEGLDAAHSKGIIHRDVKPSNMFVTTSGHVKIFDFGLVKLLRPSARTPGAAAACEETNDDTRTRAEDLTFSGAALGTVAYMSPEQALGKEIDARSDLFSLGVVLYEMATGVAPFHGSTYAAVCDEILHKTPAAPLRLNSDIPETLQQIITKALEKDRDLRYQSAREILADLRRVQRLTSAQRFVADAGESLRPRRVSGIRRWRLWIGVFSLAVLVLTGVLWFRDIAARRDSAALSIAVLPFEYMSSDKDQAYFAEGIAEELQSHLARIPGLHVPGSTSSFQFKDKKEDLQTMGKVLRVSKVLAGSVSKEGRRVRVIAKLLNVADGYTLWTDVYNRELTDLFTVQQDIARSVTRALKGTLLGATEGPALSKAPNGEAYNQYLAGRSLLARRTQEEWQEAAHCFERAIALAPDYAPAWVGKSLSYQYQAALGYASSPESYRIAREAAEKALAIDPELADAHAAMAAIQNDHDWDWAGADASYRKALALDPSNSAVLLGAEELFRTQGRFHEAYAACTQAIDYDPLNVLAYYRLGYTLYCMGRLDAAETAFRKVFELEPNYNGGHYCLGLVQLARANLEEALREVGREKVEVLRTCGMALVYHKMGRESECRDSMRKLISEGERNYAFQIAEAYAYLGEIDKAFEWLGRAYSQHDPGLALIKGDPLLKSLEPDPRFGQLLKKMHLPM